MRISGQSILATVIPNALQNGRDPATFQGLNPQGPEGQFGYTIPNLLIDHAMRNPHVPPGFWRGVNNNQNAIYLECFMDELAHSAKQDPLEFRRKLMANHPKHLAVLNAVAEKAGWGKPASPGVFRGIAQHMGYGSYVAACAEVSVSDAGVLKIHRIVAGTDCGVAVNPQQIEAQIEGSFVYGLTAMLYGEITIKDGAGRTGELRHLPDDADGRDAGGRVGDHAVRRLLGRCRRADHLRGGACSAERDLCRHRQAHPPDAAVEGGPAQGLRRPARQVRHPNRLPHFPFV